MKDTTAGKVLIVLRDQMKSDYATEAIDTALEKLNFSCGDCPMQGTKRCEDCSLEGVLNA